MPEARLAAGIWVAAYLRRLALADIPAADAELVDAADERALLAAWRGLPRRSQQLVLELANALLGPRRRSPRA